MRWAISTAVGLLPELGPLSLSGSWQSFNSEPARSALAERLARYAREQRWYPPAQAAQTVQEPQLRKLILKFGAQIAASETH